jgi:hypothetical protein
VELIGAFGGFWVIILNLGALEDTMSKLSKFLAIAVMIGGALAMTPAPANAQHHHGGFGHFHGGHFRGGWGGGWGWGPGPFWGGYGYPYYAAAPGCGYVRVWRRHHWILVRNWRCW